MKTRAVTGVIFADTKDTTQARSRTSVRIIEAVIKFSLEIDAMATSISLTSNLDPASVEGPRARASRIALAWHAPAPAVIPT